MISCAHVLDRKIKESNIEEIFDRLQRATTDQSFFEILAELGKEIASNPLFEPYIKYIAEKEKTYRKTPHIYTIIQYASFCAQGEQQLNQEMLIRTERISEYFSVWLIIRSNELYDISLHHRVRSELKESGNLRDLADFEEGIVVVSIVLKGGTNWNLRDFYLPHAHRTVSGIINFFDNQQQVSSQAQNIDEKNPTHPQKSVGIKYKREITITVGNDEVAFSTTDQKPIVFERYNKVNKEKNLRFYLILLLCQNKQGIKKREFEKQLDTTNIEFNRAKRGIVDEVSNKWIDVKHILKLDVETKKITFNDKYHIVFLKS